MNTEFIKRILSKYRLLVQFFLISIGVALILGSAYVSYGSRVERALFGLGLAMVSSTVIAMFNTVLGADFRSVIQETVGFQQDVKDTGLEKIHLHIGDETIFELFSSAHTIDMMYNSAQNTIQRYGDRIVDAIATNGCRVRILTSDPQNTIWNDQAIRNALCPGTDIPREISDVLSYINILVDELKQSQPHHKPGSIEVRQFSCVPTSSIVIVNGHIARHTPYLPYSHSSEVPIYDAVKRKSPGLFEKYQNTFNRVWKLSRPVLKVEFSDIKKGNTKKSNH